MRRDSVAELSTGVRCRRPPIASRARSTSSSVTGHGHGHGPIVREESCPAAPNVPDVSAGAHPVRLVLADDLRRSRFLLLFRLLLVLPHIVWFLLWGIAAWFVAFLNWLAVMFVAESPPDFHRFLAAYVRYATHVMAFLFLAANPFPGFLGRPGYPVDVEIDPPARQNRWAAGFRLVLSLLLALAPR